jgi:hypothetical protein
MPFVRTFVEEKMAEAVLRRPEWSRLQIGLNGFMLPDFFAGGPCNPKLVTIYS